MKDKAKKDFENGLRIDLVLTLPTALGGLAAAQFLSGLIVGGSIGLGFDYWSALGKKKFKSKNPTPQ